MLGDQAWGMMQPFYLNLIKYGVPAFFFILLLVLFVLYVRFIYNKIFDILHPDRHIETQKTNTWYVPFDDCSDTKEL